MIEESRADMVDVSAKPDSERIAVADGIVFKGHQPKTQRLEHSAYRPMALVKMKQVAVEICQCWALVQGIGTLSLGQNTVLIACSSGHRNERCFEVARYGIDRLKVIVPVWKKKVGPDGSTWIEGDYVPSPEDCAAD